MICQGDFAKDSAGGFHTELSPQLRLSLALYPTHDNYRKNITPKVAAVTENDSQEMDNNETT